MKIIGILALYDQYKPISKEKIITRMDKLYPKDNLFPVYDES